MGILFYTSIILFSGLALGKLVKLVKLPTVCGYLFAGLLIGPYTTGIIPLAMLKDLSFIPDIALAFIGFTIGAEFKISYFKKVGFTPVVIALFEALAAQLFVTLTLHYIFNCDMAFSILLGALAAATDPASTIMVINQYKAKGKVSETLLSVVALDDVVALVAFGFAATISKSLTGGVFTFSSLAMPLLEIFVSIVIGCALGFIFSIVLKYYKSRGNTLSFTIAFILVAIGLAEHFGASPILTSMIMGAFLTNISPVSNRVIERCNRFTPPLFIIFFVYTCATLDVSVLPTVGVLGLAYLVSRVIGKLVGARLGATIMHAPETVKKYLGPTLIPQAGVAIGLTLAAGQIVPESSAQLTAIVLSSTIIYVITGPIISKKALQKAGEISKEA